MKIRNFQPKDTAPVINLWKKAKIVKEEPTTTRHRRVACSLRSGRFLLTPRVFHLFDSTSQRTGGKLCGFYSPWDKKENLIKKYQKEPELFLVAEENSQIIGVVLGQYDGWGAYTHHLATADNYGKIAESLTREIEKRLKEKGAGTVFTFTFPRSKESSLVKKQKYKYWGLSAGWEKRIK